MNTWTVPLLMSAFILAGCNATTFTKIEESKRIPLSSVQVNQIKTTVTDDFLDPDSALFRDIRAVEVSLATGEREVRVCGEVNGKNALGGYTGYSMFGGSLVNGRFQQVDFFAPCEAW